MHEGYGISKSTQESITASVAEGDHLTAPAMIDGMTFTTDAPVVVRLYDVAAIASAAAGNLIWEGRIANAGGVNRGHENFRDKKGLAYQISGNYGHDGGGNVTAEVVINSVSTNAQNF